MAIKTSSFSGWRLSGKAVEALLKQVNNAKPNPLAQQNVAVNQWQGMTKKLR